MIVRFTDTEIKKLLGNIVILVDTKEQVNGHITDYFTKKKIKYKNQNLKEGDYSAYIEYNQDTKKILESVGINRNLYFTDEILIERKASLDELAGNLSSRKAKYGQDGREIRSEKRERERFKFELTRIRLCNAALYLFIEDPNGAENIRLKNYISDYSPESFLGSLQSIQSEFKCPYKFFSKKVMGSEIYHTIYYAIRDVLKKGEFKKIKDIEVNDE